MYVASNGTKTAVILRDTDPANPRDPYYQENLGKMVCWHKRYNLGDKHTFDDPIDFAQDLALKNTSWSELLLYIKDGHTKDLRLVPEGEGYQLQSRSVFDNNIWVDMAGFQFPADFSDSAAISKRIWDEAQGEITDVLKEMYTPELIDLCKDKVAILPLYLYDHSGLTMSTNDFGDRWDSGCVGFIYMDKDTAMKELGMAGNEVRIAQAMEGRRAQPIKLSRKSERDPARDVLIAQGYQKVKDLDEITNLNGPDVARYSGLRETLKDTMRQGLYKKDNKLYAFAGYNDFLTFNLKPVATYNPNILNVTEETWHARALDCLRGEVAQYDAYLRGKVYGMKFYEGKTEIEATWGFYETKDQDIRKDIFADELSDWCDDLIDKMANAAYEPEPKGDFDIDVFFEENDFPELRDKIRQDVCDYIKTDAATAQVYPYGMTPDDILANKNGVLDGIVADLYDEHLGPDTESIHSAIEERAGKSREVQPKISVADLEPDKDYTESELLAILKKKPSLSDQIAGASARQASQADNKTQPGHEQGR